MSGTRLPSLRSDITRLIHRNPERELRFFEALNELGENLFKVHHVYSKIHIAATDTKFGHSLQKHHPPPQKKKYQEHTTTCRHAKHTHSSRPVNSAAIFKSSQLYLIQCSSAIGPPKSFEHVTEVTPRNANIACPHADLQCQTLKSHRAQAV